MKALKVKDKHYEIGTKEYERYFSFLCSNIQFTFEVSIMVTLQVQIQIIDGCSGQRYESQTSLAFSGSGLMLIIRRALT